MIQGILEAVLSPFFELFLRLPGYVFLRAAFGPHAADPESDRVLVTGLLLWTAVAGATATVVRLS